jgi:hypothetical protein
VQRPYPHDGFTLHFLNLISTAASARCSTAGNKGEPFQRFAMLRQKLSRRTHSSYSTSTISLITVYSFKAIQRLSRLWSLSDCGAGHEDRGTLDNSIAMTLTSRVMPVEEVIATSIPWGATIHHPTNRLFIFNR